jgi:hypothetical protein
MVALLKRAFRIDQNIRDVLDVADLPFSFADFEERIVRGRIGIGRIKQQHAAEARANPRSAPNSPP